jgi:hypothetical protein
MSTEQALRLMEDACCLLTCLTPAAENAPGTGTAAARQTARARVTEAITAIAAADWHDDPSVCASVRHDLSRSLSRLRDQALEKNR